MRISTSKAALVIVLAIASVSGCSTNRLHRAPGGPTLLQVERSEEAYIYSVTVRTDGRDLVVSGKIKRKPNTSRDLKGHIDIVLLGSDGKPLRKVGVPYSPQTLPWPRIGMRRRSSRFLRRLGSSHFEAHIPTAPSEGRSVKVRFHKADGIPPEELSVQAQGGS